MKYLDDLNAAGSMYTFLNHGTRITETKTRDMKERDFPSGALPH